MNAVPSQDYFPLTVPKTGVGTMLAMPPASSTGNEGSGAHDDLSRQDQ
jgi:hypothetical protein